MNKLGLVFLTTVGMTLNAQPISIKVTSSNNKDKLEKIISSLKHYDLAITTRNGISDIYVINIPEKHGIGALTNIKTIFKGAYFDFEDVSFDYYYLNNSNKKVESKKTKKSISRKKVYKYSTKKYRAKKYEIKKYDIKIPILKMPTKIKLPKIKYTNLPKLTFKKALSASKVDYRKKIIFITAVYDKINLADTLELVDYVNICVKEYDKFYMIYAVNIEPKNVKNELYKIQYSFPESFIKDRRPDLKKSTYIPRVPKNQKPKVYVRFVDAVAKPKPVIKKPKVEVIKTYAEVGLDKFKEAQQLFKAKRYKEAYTKFETLDEGLVDANRVDFYLGRSAYELGEYEDALAAYDRILFDKPDNLRVKLEIAQTMLRLKNYKSARKIFTNILEEKIPDKVRSKVKNLLARIDNATRKNFFGAMAFYGISYDSNIDNGTNPGEYNIFIPSLGQNTPINPANKKGSMTHEAGVILNHVYKDSEEFRLDNSMTLYSQKYPEYKEKDLDLVSLSLAPSYLNAKSQYQLSFYYDHVWYGGVSYLNNAAVVPKFTTAIDKFLTYSSYFRYANKTFIAPTNKDKNANAFEFTNSLNIRLKDKPTLNIKAMLGKELKLQGVRTDVDKKYYSLVLATSYQFMKDLSANAEFYSLYSTYDDRDVNFQTRRYDKLLRYTFGGNYVYNKNITFTTNVQFMKQVSNQNPFDYDKYVIKTYLYYRF
ncbi:MAG: tetratricopeptide repeat protein [Helicobacteraceae bacterium]|nr:tetratricopeptide repeat protein [Helicobacteraceae bacterium]